MFCYVGRTGSVIGPLAALLALTCFGLALAALRLVGPAFRTARLLAGTAHVELGEAIGLAAGGAERYVRVSGRISSEEEFPDEHDRPLVYRRSRLELRRSGGWQALSQDSEGVEFGLEARGEYIALDAAVLGDGLVVIPREALGVLADLQAAGISLELTEDVPPDTPSRLVIEQVSAVEFAHACGVPRMAAGGPVLSSGLGRPLILTTLEVPAAMRLLASGRRRLVVAAALLLAGGLLLAVFALVALIAGL